jgi:hypothetical protein
MTFERLVVLHAVPTLCLCGLIWFVQLVHYPLFALVGDDAFVAYERAHTRRITPLVLPLMLLELGAAAWLCLLAPPSARVLVWLGAGLLALVWLSTFLLQVPCHTALEQRADADAMQRLVATNWLRTWAWTGRGGLAVWLLLRAR